MAYFIKLPRIEHQSPVSINIDHIVSWYSPRKDYAITDLLTTPGVVYQINLTEDQLIKVIIDVMSGSYKYNPFSSQNKS